MVIVEPAIELAGDSSLLLTWTADDDAVVEFSVHAAHCWLTNSALPGVCGLVPGWDSLGVHFDPQLISAEELQRRVLEILRGAVSMEFPPSRLVTLEVSFAAEDAVDMPAVAKQCGITVEACVQQITGAELRVRMIGFAPGFPYLTGLPELLRVPRRATPRLRVPAGSLALAGGLAGIYPQPSPGGWQLVGRVLRPLFSLQSSPVCLLRPGDRVQFVDVRSARSRSGEGETAT